MKLAIQYLEFANSIKLNNCSCECTETGEVKYNNYPKYFTYFDLVKILIDFIYNDKYSYIIYHEAIYNFIHYTAIIFTVIYLYGVGNLLDVTCYSCNGKNLMKCIMKDIIYINFQLLDSKDDVDNSICNIFKISSLYLITRIMLCDIKNVDSMGVVIGNKISTMRNEVECIMNDILLTSIFCFSNDYSKFLNMLKLIFSKVVKCFTQIKK